MTSWRTRSASTSHSYSHLTHNMRCHYRSPAGKLAGPNSLQANASNLVSEGNPIRSTETGNAPVPSFVIPPHPFPFAFIRVHSRSFVSIRGCPCSFPSCTWERTCLPSCTALRPTAIKIQNSKIPQPTYLLGPGSSTSPIRMSAPSNPEKPSLNMSP